MLDLSITWQEVVYSAILAFFITWLIRNLFKIRRILKQANVLLSQPKDIKDIINKCHTMFPKEMFQFNGKTYTRGMQLKITTIQNKIFEGEFIGCNEQNVVCIITSKYIVAHEIEKINSIEEL